MTQLESNFFEAAIRWFRENTSKQIDWEQRRYEIAKDVLPILLPSPNLGDGEMPAIAVKFADALIEELKK